jgi:catalase
MNEGQKAQLFSNIAEAMDGVPDYIIERQMKIFNSVSPDYAKGVQKALGK